MKKLSILTVMLMLVTTTASAMSSTLSKVTVMGQPYYKYQVKKGDTMYGIARQFGWDEKLIQQSNPGELTTLKKGSVIYYPCDTDDATQNNTADKGAVIDNNGVTHRIERGETLSSIARVYGMTPGELIKLNPGAGDYIKAGDTLIISGHQQNSGDKNNGIDYHLIQTGETLYGIGKRYNVSVEALLKSNPGVSERNFRAGETIRIPVSGTGIVITTEMVREDVLKGFRTHKVKKDETWNSIARRYGIPSEALMEANSGVELKKNVYIGVPIVASEEVSRQVVDEDKREVQEIYADINGINDSTDYTEIRFAVVSDNPSSRRDREIMRGVLMAVDKLKNSGSKIMLKMLEGGNSDSATIGELDTFRPSVVMSTADTDFPEWLAGYANDRRVPVINTLDVKNVDFQTNPYMVQLIATPDYFNEEVANWIFQKYGSYSLVFTGEKDPNDALAESLQAIWDPSRVRSRSVEDLRSLPLNAKGKYLLYSYPTKKADVIEFLDAVNDTKTKTPESEVTVIGRPNWIVFDEVLADKFHNADVEIPARFYMTKAQRNNSDFSMRYRQLYNSTVPNTFPVYSGIGYDTALYFLEGLAAGKGDINAMGQPSGTVQSEYCLERPSNWSGLLNRSVYMVRFTPYDSIEKTVVK